KTAQQRAEISIDEPLNVDWDGNELLLSDLLGTDGEEVCRGVESESERRLLREAVMRLSPRERQIMEMRFGLKDGQERTQKEVADAIGISQSYISRLEKRIIRRLRAELEDLIFS
ncbi:MAG: sigma-70 family RNA polymerase sigma factor, partial [Oscillospiraceae bacterium]|nr:sigma-70 family RNA polymerase sigma factor [Oscillospiraceae bacterium]